MKIKNCINCGAPLHGRKCEYCGTEYTENGGVFAAFPEGEVCGTLSVGDVTYRCYIGSMEAHTICMDAQRDIYGNLHIDRGCLKHKFTLIEM